MIQFGKLSAMIKMSLRSLLLHKLRSFLTILGLVFGVASVIIMLAIAEGAGQEAQRQIESLGIQNVIVRSVKPFEDSNSQEEGVKSYGLNYTDMQRIKETLQDVEHVSPLREFNYECRYKSRFMEARVVGIQEEYAITNSLEIATGRFLSEADREKNVCVIGDSVAKRLFAYESPIGKSIQIGTQFVFEVVGVTKPKMSSAGAGSSLSAQDFNEDVYIPLTTDRSRIGELLVKIKTGSYSAERLLLSQITVRVKHSSQVKRTASSIDSLLKSTHEKPDFKITIPLDLLERAKATQRIFNFVLGSIAAISLLVGGIGIMNIMLATVSERTTEIGIRRALGATQSDITLQFLVETSVLSFAGAIIGAAVGIVSPFLITLFSGRETVLTLWGPLIAVLVALATGLIFGIYPARRAAKLDPIDALRHA